MNLWRLPRREALQVFCKNPFVGEDLCALLLTMKSAGEVEPNKKSTETHRTSTAEVSQVVGTDFKSILHHLEVLEARRRSSATEEHHGAVAVAIHTRQVFKVLVVAGHIRQVSEVLAVADHIQQVSKVLAVADHIRNVSKVAAAASRTQKGSKVAAAASRTRKVLNVVAVAGHTRKVPKVQQVSKEVQKNYTCCSLGDA